MSFDIDGLHQDCFVLRFVFSQGCRRRCLDPVQPGKEFSHPSYSALRLCRVREMSLGREHPTRSATSHQYESFQMEVPGFAGVLLVDACMGLDEWTHTAFALGLSARESERANMETIKMADRMQGRKKFLKTQTMESVSHVLNSITNPHTRLSTQRDCIYHIDAVPGMKKRGRLDGAGNFSVARPSVSIGYHRNVFSPLHDDLQTGIISGPDGQPYDLGRIAQPIDDHFWPFLVVEISDDSMLMARRASAVTAATCNNALHLLVEAATDDRSTWHGLNAPFEKSFLKCFSLSICQRKACFSVHSMPDKSIHRSTVVMTYDLSDSRSVGCLADRIHGICVWAGYGRLEELVRLLDRLDAKVNGAGIKPYSTFRYDFDPASIPSAASKQTDRSEKVRLLFGSKLSRWIR